jgi:hypothetical protein
MLKTLNAENDADLMQIINMVLRANKVVVISGLFFSSLLSSQLQQYLVGAGISVAAGLPAFRGDEGLYRANKLRHCFGYKGNIENLFSVSSLRVSIYASVPCPPRFTISCRIITQRKSMPN